MKRLPISPKYDRAIYEAVALQILFGLLGVMILDGGRIAQICGMALIAFWGGAAVLIWRHPQSPSRTDIECIRFGYLPLIFISAFLSGAVWHLRGVL
jgi:hypothetical protein